MVDELAFNDVLKCVYFHITSLDVDGVSHCLKRKFLAGLTGYFKVDPRMERLRIIIYNGKVAKNV